MSSYTFVPSYHDLGLARGPRSAFIVHMAEGGGTVGYLSRPNLHGVSVHFVIEYSGRVVQMLPLNHMHSSIRTSAIRVSDDSDGFYGASAAQAVMGKWADVRDSLGPNHGSLAVEIEGWADKGPSTKQSQSLASLYDDMERKYPGMRALGHRDFASYKACPGRKIDWDSMGGHGAEEGDMYHVKYQMSYPSIGVGRWDGPGHYLLNTSDPRGKRYGPRDPDERFTIVARCDLVDPKGVPIDIDGNQPPREGRDRVYIVDGVNPDGKPYGADCFALVNDVILEWR